jgi:hypothetical protein
MTTFDVGTNSLLSIKQMLKYNELNARPRQILTLPPVPRTSSDTENKKINPVAIRQTFRTRYSRGKCLEKFRMQLLCDCVP